MTRLPNVSDMYADGASLGFALYIHSSSLVTFVLSVTASHYQPIYRPSYLSIYLSIYLCTSLALSLWVRYYAGLTCRTSLAPLRAAEVYFNEATGGRYVPRAVLMDLEPGPCVHSEGLPCVFESDCISSRSWARNNGLRASRTFWSALPSRQLRVWTDRTAQSSMWRTI